MDSVVIAQPRSIGLAVRDRRRELGLTQAQLAQRAGVSVRLVVSLELGDAPGIQLNKLLAVLDALGLSLYAVLSSAPAPSSQSLPVPAADAEEYETAFGQATRYLHEGLWRDRSEEGRRS